LVLADSIWLGRFGANSLTWLGADRHRVRDGIICMRDLAAAHNRLHHQVQAMDRHRHHHGKRDICVEPWWACENFHFVRVGSLGGLDVPPRAGIGFYEPMMARLRPS
jgi:hypothetical protein